MGRKKVTYKFQGTGLLPEEIQWSRKRFDDYCEHYPKLPFADYPLLEELVVREAWLERYKKKIAELQSNDEVKEKGLIPSGDFDRMNEILKEILTLRAKLGFKDVDRDSNPLKYLEMLARKFKVWEDDHVEERKLPCPFCGRITVYHVRMNKYEPSKLKLFVNKVLCNVNLYRLYKAGRITKEEYASVLDVVPRYIDWLETYIEKNKEELN